MKYFLTLTASIFLAMSAPVFADFNPQPGFCDTRPNHPHCHEDGGNGGNGGGVWNGDVNVTNTNTNTNTNSLTNTNTNTLVGEGGSLDLSGGDSSAVANANLVGEGGSLSVTGGDSTSSAYNGGNTLIIGGSGEGEGEGFGGNTLSPTATATNGDQTLTNSNTATGGTGLVVEEGGTFGSTNNNTASGGAGGSVALEDGAVTGLNVEGDMIVSDGETPLGGSAQAVGGVANASVAEGAVDLNVDASTTTNYKAPKIPVATAATSFSSVCTSGAAGQGKSIGLSLAVTSDQCAHLMQADAYMALGGMVVEVLDDGTEVTGMEMALEHVNKAARHANRKGFMGHIRHIVTLGIL